MYVDGGVVFSRMDLHSSEPILVYLCESNSMIPIVDLESDSIASVKLRIEACKGFTVKTQKPMFGGWEVGAGNKSFVKEYGVSSGDVMLLGLKLSDLLAITIITACRKEYEVQVANVEDGDEYDDDDAIQLLVKNPARVKATPIEKDVELSIVASEEKRTDFMLEPVIMNPKTIIPSAIWGLIRATFDGLAKGYQPIRSTEGTGGTYFMRDACGHKIVGVFKPIDEEPMAVNNPGGLPITENGVGLKKGTRVGEGALREVAAYVLDHPKNGRRSSNCELMGFSGVPPTPMVRCMHKAFNHPEPHGYNGSPTNVKTGSLQMFRENDGNCEDIGPQAFPVEEVHKISVIDIRLANVDRHAGNILYHRDPNYGTIQLIPIDHGYCMPDSFEDCTFDWLYWPQARQPFSQDTTNYIKTLDAEEDLELLKFLGWEVPNECARVLRISTMLLKKGAERGLSPFTIGRVMCRETLNKESIIEQIIREAQGEVDFMQAVSTLLDICLGKLNKDSLI